MMSAMNCRAHMTKRSEFNGNQPSTKKIRMDHEMAPIKVTVHESSTVPIGQMVFTVGGMCLIVRYNAVSRRIDIDDDSETYVPVMYVNQSKVFERAERTKFRMAFIRLIRYAIYKQSEWWRDENEFLTIGVSTLFLDKHHIKLADIWKGNDSRIWTPYQYSAHRNHPVFVFLRVRPISKLFAFGSKYPCNNYQAENNCTPKCTLNIYECSILIKIEDVNCSLAHIPNVREVYSHTRQSMDKLIDEVKKGEHSTLDHIPLVILMEISTYFVRIRDDSFRTWEFNRRCFFFQRNYTEKIEMVLDVPITFIVEEMKNRPYCNWSDIDVGFKLQIDGHILTEYYDFDGSADDSKYLLDQYGSRISRAFYKDSLSDSKYKGNFMEYSNLTTSSCSKYANHGSNQMAKQIRETFDVLDVKEGYAVQGWDDREMNVLEECLTGLMSWI